MTADAGADHYREILQKLLEGPDMDGALVITTPTSTMTGESVARAILAAKTTTTKPIAACLFGVNDLSREVSLLEENGVPTFTFPEEAAQGLGALAKYHAWRTRPKTPVRTFSVDHEAVRAVIHRAQAGGTVVLSDSDARALLTAYGIRFPDVRFVRSVDQAVAAADGPGGAVGRKI
jgi:acetyltransferase